MLGGNIEWEINKKRRFSKKLPEISKKAKQISGLIQQILDNKKMGNTPGVFVPEKVIEIGTDIDSGTSNKKNQILEKIAVNSILLLKQLYSLKEH